MKHAFWPGATRIGEWRGRVRQSINKRLSIGGYESVEDVLRRALEARDAEKTWTDRERRALSAHIEEGYQQAERGELIDGARVPGEIQAMKNDWRLSRR